MVRAETDFAVVIPQRRLRAIARRLSVWYAQNARDLPWRRTRDPYAIWVSEIMLQQTQVDTVQPYYLRWMKAFPDVTTLALAPIDEVLQLWEGLGYYSRARNLQRAAQVVVQKHDGILPASVEGLRALPGIGPYTAAAIASIAFGADAAVVDGNVKRVLARLFLYEGDVKSTGGVQELQALADRLVPQGRAGDHNQAVMDLGATLCTPRRPRCEACPVRTSCLAYRTRAQESLPRSTRRKPVATRKALIGVVADSERVLIEKRQTRLLGGLWAFPFIEYVGEANPARIAELRNLLEARCGPGLRQPPDLLGEFSHTYTHFKISAQAWHFVPGQTDGVPVGGAVWVNPAQLATVPMSRLDRRIANMLSRLHPEQPNTNP